MRITFRRLIQSTCIASHQLLPSFRRVDCVHGAFWVLALATVVLAAATTVLEQAKHHQYYQLAT
jgi:hypothetical protein